MTQLSVRRKREEERKRKENTYGANRNGNGLQEK